MSEALIIFKAISSAAQKTALFQKVLSTSTQITVKDKYERTVVMKVLSINNQFHLKCISLDGTELNLTQTENYLASFTIGDERYLFETRPLISDDNITLSVLGLFHLQRRKNFRYTMPSDYSAQFTIDTINAGPCNHMCKLLDLSTEGCAVEIGTPGVSFNLHDQVHADVFLGDRPSIRVSGVIKNIRPHGMMSLVLGVEFNHLGQESEDKIVHSISSLQRELYFRKAG